jgi:hypothetical protein
MKNCMILIGVLIFLGGSAANAAIATTHNIYVVAPGASLHQVSYYDGILYDDYWTNGYGIISANYTDKISSGVHVVAWSDVSLQFNLALLAGSRVQSARIHFRAGPTESPNDSDTIPVATLNHYGGDHKPTGNAQDDRLTGEYPIRSFFRPDAGKWLDTDVTSLLKNDLAKGHQWAVFSVNHVATSETLLGTFWGTEGFSDVLIVETLPLQAIPQIDLLLLGD